MAFLRSRGCTVRAVWLGTVRCIASFVVPLASRYRSPRVLVSESQFLAHTHTTNPHMCMETTFFGGPWHRAASSLDLCVLLLGCLMELLSVGHLMTRFANERHTHTGEHKAGPKDALMKAGEVASLMVLHRS